MRDYNFRRKAKIKEQMRRKHLNDTHYWPTMPVKRDTNNSIYYIEGIKSHRKKWLKKYANKAVRLTKLTSVNKGSHYKKFYDLNWLWY